jgi:hypothetical protein
VGVGLCVGVVVGVGGGMGVGAVASAVWVWAGCECRWGGWGGCLGVSDCLCMFWLLSKSMTRLLCVSILKSALDSQRMCCKGSLSARNELENLTTMTLRFGFSLWLDLGHTRGTWNIASYML